MNLKPTYLLLTLAFLFTFTTNANLEARQGRHTKRVEVINHTYYSPYTTHYVEYYPQPVYITPAPSPVFVAQPQPVIYAEQPVVYRERVVVRERTSPVSLFTSFALGLGIGLIR